MNLLSVSALMKEGATLHFEDHFENDEGNSWLQHPDMPTRIMMEERRGLFVLPSSNRVQSLYLTTKGSVLWLCAVAATIARDPFSFARS